MLSNKMTPVYYGRFRDAVLAGKIPVCEPISLQMKRIDRFILNPGYYYDEEAVEHWVNFCENELCLTDGSPFHMMDSFKLWGENIFGWYYFDDRSVYEPSENGRPGHYARKRFVKRLTNKFYEIVGRGAAKSMFAASIQGYFLVCDPATTYQVTTAPTMDLAEEVMMPLRTAITRSPGPLFKMLTEGSLQNTTGSKANRQKLASTKKGIQNFLTESLLQVRPMTINKLQGLRLKCGTVDEWLSGDIREDVVGALEQGASKEQSDAANNDWLLVMTSSEGTVRNGPGDDIKLELMSILKNDYIDDHTAIWWYKLDDLKEISRPDLWVKANPNIGITVSYDTYQRDVDRANQVPSARNDIIAKRFDIPMEGFTYFFTYSEIQLHRRREYWGMPCALGADLSQGDDFCAFTFLFPLSRGYFGVKTRSYITERTLFKITGAMRFKYDEFINEGTLIVMPGTTLNMIDVYEDLDSYINNTHVQYDIRAFGFDPYNAAAFVERWAKENGEECITKVIQGSKTESVPLGELKHLAEDRLLLFDEKLMNFAMGNSIVLEDTNGNRKLYKKRHDAKIDNVAAMMDAYVAYTRFPEAFD